MEILEPSEIKVGTRVFCPYPSSRTLVPAWDTGTVDELGSPGMVWVAKVDANGKRYRTPYHVDRLEAIG